MTRYLYANNATTTLAQSVSATTTIINVASGDGDLFPSPSSGEAFAITFVDATTGLQNEIAYCTARSGDALTITRGQEGKNAREWSAGDIVANYITAGVIESWLQEEDIADLQKALGFTPVEQGGGPNQTDDKVNIGQDSTYQGLLRVAIDGADHGTLLSGTYLATITGTTGDLPGMGLWFQAASQRPAFTYQDATGLPKIIDLAMYSDVQTLQSNLSSFQTTQTKTNATLSADFSDCVSGVYGVDTSSGDTQGKSLYQAGGSGRPTFVYNNGTTDVYSALAYYADVTALSATLSTDISTVQSNLTSFQTSQAAQNSTFSTEIASKVSTNTTNDGVNSPITYLGHNNASGAPFVISSLLGSYRIIPSRPGSGYNSISNMSTDSNGDIILADSSGNSYSYMPAPTVTMSGNPGDENAYTIIKTRCSGTPSGWHIRMFGVTAEYTAEGRQTITLPVALSGIFPGAYGASTLLVDADSTATSNDQMAQVSGTPTTTEIVINMNLTGGGNEYWPIKATWWIEGY